MIFRGLFLLFFSYVSYGCFFSFSFLLNMEPITVDNFFVKSIGTFTEVDKLPEGLEFNFKSKSSTYYVNAEKTHLWRISDHWGKKIRECDWFLDGFPVGSSYGWQKKYGKGMKIGMIAFADLRPNLKPTHFNKNKKPKTKSEPESWLKPTVKVQPSPTLMPCRFSKDKFCRTQKEICGMKYICDVRRGSWAHESCARINGVPFIKDEETKKERNFPYKFMTTEADDYNSRK